MEVAEVVAVAAVAAAAAVKVQSVQHRPYPFPLSAYPLSSISLHLSMSE